MKHLAILLAVVMCILICKETSILSKTTEPATYELKQLLTFTDELDVTLSNWQITMKENREIKDIARFIHNLSGYRLTKAKEDNLIKWSGNRQKMTGMDESLLIVRTNREDNMYQISYTISFDAENGIKTNGLDSADEILRTITKDLFTNNAQYFACLEVHNSGKIDIAYFLKKLELRLDMTIYDELNEARLKTWTGKTPQWDNFLKLNNKEINCQIAVREGTDDQTSITIGTPILINEY